MVAQLFKHAVREGQGSVDHNGDARLDEIGASRCATVVQGQQCWGNGEDDCEEAGRMTTREQDDAEEERGREAKGG